jgi:hypothetical protein
LLLCLQRAQAYDNWRGIAVLFGSHALTPLKPVLNVRFHFLAVAEVIENRCVNLLQSQRWETSSNLFGGLFAEQILIKHRFYADPMPFDADVIRRQKVEILFELHRYHLSTPVIPQTLKAANLQKQKPPHNGDGSEQIPFSLTSGGEGS